MALPTDSGARALAEDKPTPMQKGDALPDDALEPARNEVFGRGEGANSPKSSSIRRVGTCDRIGVVTRRIFHLYYPLVFQGAR